MVRYLELTPVDASLLMTPPRPAAQSFRDLLVWRKAHEFVLAVYAFTAGFPRQETYGLALQMGRAAASVPAHVSVAAGATLSTPFTVTTYVVAASTVVTLTATCAGGPATSYAWTGASELSAASPFATLGRAIDQRRSTRWAW